MASSSIVLSPASPEELLHYVVTYQLYPTTLLICSSRAEFVASLIQAHVAPLPDPEQDSLAPVDNPSRLLRSPLAQAAVARHLRVLFIPTVTHLRSFLPVISSSDSSTPAPPNLPTASARNPPLLLCYGFLDLHRHTPEWSAQGLMNTAAVLVENAKRIGFKAVIVEPRRSAGSEGFKVLLQDYVPVLSGSSRRDDGGWTGRTVELRRVLGRWFTFQTGQWDAA